MFSSVLNPNYEVDPNHLKTIQDIIEISIELPKDSWDFTPTRALWRVKNKEESVITPSSNYKNLEALRNSNFHLGTFDNIFLLLNQMERSQEKNKVKLVFMPEKIVASFNKNSDNISFYLKNRYNDIELRSLIFVHSFDSISIEQKNILKDFPDDGQIGMSSHDRLNLISLVGDAKFDKFLFYTKTFEHSKILYVKNKNEKEKDQSFHILCSTKI